MLDGAPANHDACTQNPEPPDVTGMPPQLQVRRRALSPEGHVNVEARGCCFRARDRALSAADRGADALVHVAEELYVAHGIRGAVFRHE